jgi:hypothetical protein
MVIICLLVGPSIGLGLNLIFVLSLGKNPYDI